MEKIAKVLSNVTQSFTNDEKECARQNIGAQAQLTAGTNVTIDSDNVISSTDTTYTAGTNVSISDQNVISATDTTYSAGAGLNLNGTEFSVDTNTIQAKLSAGSNISINGNTISATDTTYNVFNTTTDGLVPKASGTGDTEKFLKGDGTWEAINTTVSATAPLYGTGTAADPLILRTSHGLSLVTPANTGITYLQVTHPVPAPGSTSAGKVLTCDDALENLSWQTPASAPSIVQKLDYGDTSASTVSTLLIDADDPEGYAVVKCDGSNKGALVVGPYKSLLDSGINGGAGVGDSSTPIYVDTDGTFKAGTAPVTGGKHSHTAELYYHHYDDGDHYNVRNVKNYCINHVAITNHSSDICYIEVEAPTLGTDEEYDYYVVFDCTNSSGGCNVTVQNCDAEIFKFPFYNPNGPQGQPFVDFQDKTETWVEFTGSPRYQVEVIGNRYTVHRF